MASRAHQFIADLIARKMNLEGYDVMSFDGLSEAQRIKLKLPPKIIRHRPDLLGINSNNYVCIGEAKTASDMTERTREQIEDFCSLGIRVYFGIPESIGAEFGRLVEGLIKEDQRKLLTVIRVPDRLLPQEEDKYE